MYSIGTCVPVSTELYRCAEVFIHICESLCANLGCEKKTIFKDKHSQGTVTQSSTSSMCVCVAICTPSVSVGGEKVITCLETQHEISSHCKNCSILKAGV